MKIIGHVDNVMPKEWRIIKGKARQHVEPTEKDLLKDDSHLPYLGTEIKKDYIQVDGIKSRIRINKDNTTLLILISAEKINNAVDIYYELLKEWRMVCRYR